MKRSFCLVLMSLASPAAMAALTDVDTSFGAATATYDSVTELTWLDLDQSLNISWNDMAVARGPGGAYEGWRYATSTELAGFYTAIGYNPFDDLTTRIAQVQAIVATTGLGAVAENPTNGFYRVYGDGWLGDAGGLGHETAGYGYDLFFDVPSMAWASSDNWGSGSDTYASDTIGHWLVMDPPCDDSDGDSICDSADLCPNDPTNTDSDGDAICDDDDRCPNDPTNTDDDGDFLCGADDTCPLDPTNLDSDGDTVCDPDDPCINDRFDLDSDGDAVCDVDDFLLVIASPPVRGSLFTMSVERAVPGTKVAFLATTMGEGDGPCVSAPTEVCADLLAPKLLGVRPVGPGGTASLSLTVPRSLPGGGAVWIQAVYSAPGGADTTQVLGFDVR